MRFGKNYNFYKPKIYKQAGLYEIESIDNQNILTFSINHKEYYEQFRNGDYNNKHKAINKSILRLDFERYAKRSYLLKISKIILKLREPKPRLQRFQTKNRNIQMTSILKSRFSSLNYKRYISDGMVSLSFDHPILEKKQKIKKDFRRRIHKHIHEIKD